MMYALAFAAALVASPPPPMAPQEWDTGVICFHDGVAKLRKGEPSRQSFRDAAAAFEKASRTDHEVRSMNIGNSYYLAGDLPEAIAAYHGGLAHHPFNRDLRNGLLQARREVATATHPAPSAWPWFLFERGIDWLAVLSLLVASFFVSAGFCSKRRRLLLIGFIAAAVFAMAATAIAVREQFWFDLRDRPVAVIREQTPLHAGNAESYPALAELPPGLEVRVLGMRGGWSRVQCPDGSIGWIPAGRSLHPARVPQIR